ncbi:hypothetical protein NMT03_003882 [Vibrio alginolyticus]|uniref:hypothetical protein n=1 Tax=Vibrio alginolyticus TaxID=663 RepID=UPI00215E3A9C|nr:hypothetical protein [Vibrio alginolyticus]EJL6927797.1 hypothetical protein [Vibrio alginolyticus]MCS0235842.1 hypothetical protein [Vibrio alginolyticus]
MTKPAELLESVVERFPMLLHNEPAALNALLKKAIGKYQDLAGFMAKARIDELDAKGGTYSLPERFMTRVTIKDKAGRYVSADVWGNQLELDLSGSEEFPLTLLYLENLRDADYTTIELPASSVTLISDYLELLIMSPNSDRLRRVSVAGKLDASDIPTEADLAARRTELEEKIKSSQAMIPMITI